MQEQDNNTLAQQFKDATIQLNTIDVNYIAMAVALVKERANFVSDLWNLSDFFFVAPKDYDKKAAKKAIKEDTKSIMDEVIKLLNANTEFTVEKLQEEIKGWITTNEISFGKVMMPLRLALVGALKGPDVFDIIYMIGKNETIKRIENLNTI